VAEAPFRNYLGGNTTSSGDLTRFYAEPNSVLVGAGLADRYGLKIDDPIRLQINDRIETLTLVGILTPQDESNRRALDGWLLMDVGTAQEVLGQLGRLTRIDLILTDAEAAQLAAKLPASARLAPASEQSNTVAQLTSAFQLNLTALSLLALVVGMFLIYNTIMFSVVQRRAVLGTLRSLGVTGEQIFALILLEAAVVAAIGAGRPRAGLAARAGRGAAGHADDQRSLLRGHRA
jgi:putative ABC transport system permease protein